MDKSKISFIIGMVCTMVGAFVINQGFGFIVTGIWAFIASFVESLKQDEQEEPKAPIPKKEIWHCTMLQPPGSNGDIVLMNTEQNQWLVGEYYEATRRFFCINYPDGLTWAEIQEFYNYDKWCYLEDLIKR